MASERFAVFAFVVFALVSCALASPPTDPKDRALAAIVGAFVADAATMPLHWIYDVNQIAQMVGDKNPEFYFPPSCPYYNYTEGTGSPYGQQTSVFLSQISSGQIDYDSIASAYYAYYTAGGQCAQNCYLDASTKEFIQNYGNGSRYPNCGGNDEQADAVAHMIPVVALYAGQPNLLELVDSTIRITQNTEEAAGFGCAAARILEKAIINGTSGLEAVQQVAVELLDPNRVHPLSVDAYLASGLQRVLNELNKPNIDVCLEIGQSCDYPNNLWTGSHLIAQEAEYVNATRQTIMAGGDNCSRNMFVQSFNAALAGIEVIPASWAANTTAYPQVLQWAQTLVNHRSD